MAKSSRFWPVSADLPIWQSVGYSLRVPRVPPAAPLTLRQLYRSMRLPDLLALREAFILDRGDAELRLSLTVKAFCEERLELIESVLKEQAALRKARAKKRAALKGQRLMEGQD
jgi:hypothetical protein